MYENFEKCAFLLTEVKFLGHVIFGRGIVMDAYKIEVVLIGNNQEM